MSIESLGPLFTSLSGAMKIGAKRYHMHKLPTGKIKMRPVRPSFGSAHTDPMVAYMRRGWNILENEYKTLDYHARGEWGRCMPYTRGHAIGHHAHFKQINLNRFLMNWPGLHSPPDKFKSHKIYATNAQYPGIPAGKVIPVWRDGTKKDGEPFDPFTGQIPPPDGWPWAPDIPVCYLETPLLCLTLLAGHFPKDVPHSVTITITGAPTGQCVPMPPTLAFHSVDLVNNIIYYGAPLHCINGPHVRLHVQPDPYDPTQWHFRVWAFLMWWAKCEGPNVQYEGFTTRMCCDTCGCTLGDVDCHPTEPIFLPPFGEQAWDCAGTTCHLSFPGCWPPCPEPL